MDVLGGGAGARGFFTGVFGASEECGRTGELKELGELGIGAEDG